MKISQRLTILSLLFVLWGLYSPPSCGAADDPPKEGSHQNVPVKKPPLLRDDQHATSKRQAFKNGFVREAFPSFKSAQLFKGVLKGNTPQESLKNWDANQQMKDLRSLHHSVDKILERVDYENFARNIPKEAKYLLHAKEAHLKHLQQINETEIRLNAPDIKVTPALEKLKAEVNASKKHAEEVGKKIQFIEEKLREKLTDAEWATFRKNYHDDEKDKNRAETFGRVTGVATKSLVIDGAFTTAMALTGGAVAVIPATVMAVKFPIHATVIGLQDRKVAKISAKADKTEAEKKEEIEKINIISTTFRSGVDLGAGFANGFIAPTGFIGADYQVGAVSAFFDGALLFPSLPSWGRGLTITAKHYKDKIKNRWNRHLEQPQIGDSIRLEPIAENPLGLEPAPDLINPPYPEPTQKP